MEDVRQRLVKCFSAVFPELTKEEIVNTTSDGPSNWDSLSQVTLIAVIQEEFDIEFGADLVEGGVSFEAILARVNQATGSNIPPGASRL